MTYLILKILLALKMAPKDKDLQEIYNRVFEDAMEYMIRTIMESEVESYIPTKETKH